MELLPCQKKQHGSCTSLSWETGYPALGAEGAPTHPALAGQWQELSRAPSTGLHTHGPDSPCPPLASFGSDCKCLTLTLVSRICIPFCPRHQPSTLAGPHCSPGPQPGWPQSILGGQRRSVFYSNSPSTHQPCDVSCFCQGLISPGFNCLLQSGDSDTQTDCKDQSGSVKTLHKFKLFFPWILK